MKKNTFTHYILPSLVAFIVFLFVTIFFFSPIFFHNKTMEQHDIQQFLGSAKSIIDHRNETGEEALWSDSMFSGMPAYLISVQWGKSPLSYLKRILSLAFPTPVANIFLSFICYYILLVSFRVRPYLAIAGALAFGLSSYMIIGVAAGHNGRIGAIAFMPLVIAGMHLAFTNQKVLGFAITCLGFHLHLRENHLQITYYLFIIACVYGLVRLVEAIRKKEVVNSFFKPMALLLPAILIAAGTFFGQLWAITEYTRFSIRGPSELSTPGVSKQNTGLSKERAFEYKYGILEPMTLLIPEFYGGSSANFFVQDQKSRTYTALVNSGNNELANQLANYTSAYWGPQSFTAGPYYAGAIIIFLFIIGILFADRTYVYWLVPLSLLSIMLSWGDSFASFNYFIFDYLPGYNKFRSVNFALVIILFAMPLLGLLGLERLFENGIDKAARKRLLIAFSIAGGLSLFFLLFAGLFDFTKDTEVQLPVWFTDALADDRKSLLRGDAFRSLIFILAVFLVLYLDLHKKISAFGVYAFLVLIITIDLAVVNKRYFTDNNFKSKRDNSYFATTEADEEILKDKSHYRVYNLEGTMAEARTSYYHKSIGGYHGAKLKRYQEFYDSCLTRQTQQLITDAQQGKMNFEKYSGLNMLNIKYVMYGPQRDNIIRNSAANGSAWFVHDVVKVNSPNEEIEKTCEINTKTSAVIDVSKFPLPEVSFDTMANINVKEVKINYLKYEANTKTTGLAIFSEIYYPEGWKALIDGKEAPLLRANYILRGLIIPEGNHTIELRFEPDAYKIGNKIATASSWLLVVILLGSVAWEIKSRRGKTVK